MRTSFFVFFGAGARGGGGGGGPGVTFHCLSKGYLTVLLCIPCLIKSHSIKLSRNKLLQLCTAHTVFSILVSCTVIHCDAGVVSLVDK